MANRKDTTGVIRSIKRKDRQHNDQQKKIPQGQSEVLKGRSGSIMANRKRHKKPHKQSSTKHYTEYLKLNNKNSTKYGDELRHSGRKNSSCPLMTPIVLLL